MSCCYKDKKDTHGFVTDSYKIENKLGSDEVDNMLGLGVTGAALTNGVVGQLCEWFYEESHKAAKAVESHEILKEFYSIMSKTMFQVWLFVGLSKILIMILLRNQSQIVLNAVQDALWFNTTTVVAFCIYFVELVIHTGHVSGESHTNKKKKKEIEEHEKMLEDALPSGLEQGTEGRVLTALLGTPHNRIYLRNYSRVLTVTLMGFYSLRDYSDGTPYISLPILVTLYVTWPFLWELGEGTLVLLFCRRADKVDGTTGEIIVKELEADVKAVVMAWSKGEQELMHSNVARNMYTTASTILFYLNLITASLVFHSFLMDKTYSWTLDDRFALTFYSLFALLFLIAMVIETIAMMIHSARHHVTSVWLFRSRHGYRYLNDYAQRWIIGGLLWGLFQHGFILKTGSTDPRYYISAPNWIVVWCIIPTVCLTLSKTIVSCFNLMIDTSREKKIEESDIDNINLLKELGFGSIVSNVSKVLGFNSASSSKDYEMTGFGTTTKGGGGYYDGYSYKPY